MTRPDPAMPFPPMPRPDEIERCQQAALWFHRRKDGDWSRADERAFQQWLQADPRHAKSYQRMSDTWTHLANVPRPALFPASSAATPPRKVPLAARRSFLRAGPAWAMGIAAVALGGAWWLVPGAGYSTQLQTAHQQTKTLELPDGSRVTLNGAGELSVQFEAQHRSVQLVRGEAFFEVAADAQRPFTVQHGSAAVRVVGTAFNVRTQPGGLDVQVRHGRVEVRADAARVAPLAVLGAGQAAAVDTATGTAPERAVLAEAVGTWRTGQLVFRDTPLAEVAAELSRYRDQPVRVDSATLGRQRISGYARTNAPDAFLNALPGMLDVRIEPQDDGSIRLAPL